MAKHDLVEVEALEAFTVTRPYGQFHGDPDSKRNRVCSVPIDAVEDLLVRGKIAEPDMDESDAGDDPASDESVTDGEEDERPALRARLAELGGPVFNGWDADTLRRKIEEAEASGGSDDAPAA